MRTVTCMLVVALGAMATARDGLGRQQLSGSIRGTVVDAETRQPLPGANVVLEPGPRGTSTDADGRFAFEHVPVGAYTLRISFVGYEPHVRTDVIVRSARITQLTAALVPSVVEGQEVVVTGGYFTDVTAEIASVTAFGAEEIRRAPGAAGDVSRILFVLPSLAKIDDTRNSLIVRGGSPIENAFYVDGIAIPNVNHFPTQGSSGGPIGLLNVDLIDDVRFYTGGFSAAYGDRLSAVMDVRFREGNRDATDVQLDLNLAGAGIVGEGPFAGRRGAWLVSARRSFLDLLVNTFFDDVPVIPTYSDVQAKLVFDLTPAHRITTLSVAGFDRSGFDRDGARDVEENTYGPANYDAATNGLTWRYLWGMKGFSTTALSHSITRYRVHFRQTTTGDDVIDNRTTEQVFGLRNVNVYRPSPAHRITFGVEAHVDVAANDESFAATIDALGRPTPALRLSGRRVAACLGAFASYRWQPPGRLTLTPGLRIDHYTLTRHTHVAPRLAASYALTARTTLQAAGGVYYQALPMVLLDQDEDNSDLHDPMALHGVLGLQHLLSADTRLTVEAYVKSYRHFPLDPALPGLFIVDELFYDNGFFQQHEHLVDTGRAFTRGIEAMVQKKLARQVYGVVSAAYFRSRYRDAAGAWHDRLFDNRFLFTAEGGYKLNGRHELSIRWLYGGGAPYTPFDTEASTAAGHGIFDAARINSERLPAYHSLNVRYDRRFHFPHASLIAYLSVWNAYGRRNLATYTWNEVTNAAKGVRQWGVLPVFGLEYAF